MTRGVLDEAVEAILTGVDGLFNDLRRELWAAAIPVRICVSTTSALKTRKGFRDQKVGWKPNLPPDVQVCLIPARGSI